MSFVEICNTSNFTFLTGGSHPEEYARQAFEFGMQALAISDINSVAGIARAHIELREIARKQKDEGGNKVIPRLLAAARLITDDNFTLTALPRDRYAWGQMCRMLTVAKRRAGKENCRLRFDDILEFGDGICHKRCMVGIFHFISFQYQTQLYSLGGLKIDFIFSFRYYTILHNKNLRCLRCEK